MNPILSRHYPSCCANASRFPYVGRISVGEKDVNFVYQFVKKNVTGYTKNIKCEDHYITGTPIKFPTFEDFPQAFCMRTYGFDISTSPWQDEIDLGYTPQEYKLKMFDNHVDILFHEAVYPIRVSVYEIYNPGNIIRIWAQDSDDQWFLLWNGSPQIVPPASRLFSPPLESCNFKTKKLRLEFKPSSWDYYTKIDAVMLIGTSKLILPRNPEESITNLLRRIKCMHFHHENEDVHNLTTDYKNAHLDIVHLQQNFDEYCILHESVICSDIEKIYKSDLSLRKVSHKANSDFVQLYTQRRSRRLLLKNDLNSVKRMKLSSDESKELQRCSLSMLPDEIILKILDNSDLMTLCCLNQVNKRFYYLTRDSILYKQYKRLNVRNICHINTMYICNIFRFFTPRCKYLEQLDLSGSKFPVSHFVKFLDDCGSHLTHLRLSRCSVNNFAIRKISEICKNLKQLDLDGCKCINDEGFSYLEKLPSLEHFNVNNTNIETARLCKILQKNQQLRQLHLQALELDILDQNAIAIQLRNSCSNLEVINLDLSFRFLTSECINALADCKNLRKVNLCDVYCDFLQDSWNRLFSSCQHLEEIILSNANNKTPELLIKCQNLKRLYIWHSMSVISDKFSVILEQCPKLQEFHLIFCNINSHLIKQWRERYPRVFIYVETYKEFSEFIIQE